MLPPTGDKGSLLVLSSFGGGPVQKGHEDILGNQHSPCQTLIFTGRFDYCCSVILTSGAPLKALTGWYS